jgi:hypothetical protein
MFVGCATHLSKLGPASSGGLHFLTTVYGSGPVQGRGLGFCSNRSAAQDAFLGRDSSEEKSRRDD